ncbi:MAG TPA: hypothetical protein PK530_15695 [Anaerolineales bacterium]|nr:hypothetical protein [Anaerolineales bacterium]
MENAGRETRWGAAIRAQGAGVTLAVGFIALYFYFGLFFNNPDLYLRDNYLDADNSDWVERIAGPEGHQMDMRLPHPFAFFIFRPAGWVMNVFLATPHLSATMLNALAGGLAVFWAWKLVKGVSGSAVYALLMAALLGFSTAHLVYGSIVETYIFAATGLIGFYLLLQTRKDATGALVAASLFSFGLTISNFVQTFIGFAVVRRRWKDMFRFGLLVVGIGTALTWVHAVWYPSSRPFYLLGSSQGEEVFLFSVFSQPAWSVWGRVVLLLRTMLLYAVVAPQPLVLLEEVSGYFPTFDFYKVSQDMYVYSEFRGLGEKLMFVWVGLIGLAGVLWLWKLIKTRQIDLSVAFVGCLLFNFALHFIYGEAPFLYSADWAFALIFFVAYGLSPLARNRLFQGALLVFLGFLAYNQWQFMQYMIGVMQPFVP